MNALDLRKYWAYKYQSTFNEPYKTQNYGLDIVLLKKLLEKYGEFVAMEAMDRFVSEDSKKYASINFFASKKVFESKFQDIIKASEIMKYKRLLGAYPVDAQSQIKPLIAEYEEYCKWEVIADHEKQRKLEIVKTLQEFDKS